MGGEKTHTSVTDHWEHLKKALASNSGSVTAVYAMAESNMVGPGSTLCTRSYSAVEYSQLWRSREYIME